MTLTRPLAVLLAAATAAGCASRAQTPDRAPVQHVEGKLLVADRPASGARLAFHPVAGGPSGVCPVGVAGPDGGFVLTTYAFGDGAPAGEYVVTVMWPNETLPADDCDVVSLAAHDRLGGLYLDPAKSELRATVRPGHNTLTLHATVGGSGWNLPRLRDAEKKDHPASVNPDRSERER